jgi:P63C domain
MSNDKPASINESIQSMGGNARAESLSADERTEIARKAAQTRWSPDIPKASHEGVLKIGEASISCAVIEGPKRLLTQSDFMRVLGRARQAKGRQYYDADVNLPAFLTAKNLKPFISKDLEVTSSQIEFRTTKGAKAFGYPAELLPQVCNVFTDAAEAGVLTHNQVHIAAKAKILGRALMGVAMDALVDEATGYQDVRDRLALQALLDEYLNKELAAWAKRFPDEFYQQIYRLKGWEWKGMSKNRYSVVAKYTIDLVYERILPSLLKELEARNPKDEKGYRRGRHHQLFSDDVGHPALAQHLYALIGFMRASLSWAEFYRLVNRAFPKKGNNLELPFTAKRA